MTEKERVTRNILLLPATGYLREWTEHTFGNPVRFPLRSREHALLRYYIGARPDDVELDSPLAYRRLVKEGRPPLRIMLPVIRMRPFSRYNYLPPEGRKALLRSLRALFDIDLWNGMEPFLYGLSGVVNREIGRWCERRGISVRYEETILRHYRSMQQTYALRGLPVRPKERRA